MWDEVKTPYFVRVAKMTKEQASSEILAYVLFLAVLFAVISLVSLSDDAPKGRSYGVSIYALSVVCGAVVLGATKHYYAALYCSTAPPVALFHFFFYGFPPNLHTIDELLLLAVTLVLLRYSLRVVAIAKVYQDMPGDAQSG
ncbi:MAG: hypothetical protein ACE5GS_04300 [Kiloniellaceae bacterium]